MKIAPFVIDRFGAYLVGNGWDQAKGIVAALESHDMSGADKRAVAVKALHDLGLSLAGFVVNLAIELAVAWARSKAGK